MNYYNDNDAKACFWMEALISAGLIPPGDVDNRSIADVKPEDLDGYTQCHFFAGIGGWSYALQLAGVGPDEPVWTGSCPCQPFSAAGQGKGTDDERHLWPEFARLIRECRPATVFGEQVASKAGREWFDGVSTDLEDMGYAAAAADLCAAGVGAPHIRQRLFWLADAERGPTKRHGHEVARATSCVREEAQQRQRIRIDAVDGKHNHSRLGDTNHPRPQGHGRPEQVDGSQGRQATDGCAGATNAWSDFDLVRCVEPTKEPGRYVGKRRRVESGTQPLVAGLSGGMVPGGDPSESYAKTTAEARVSRLRGYGNAIVPQVAAEFIQAYMECREASNGSN